MSPARSSDLKDRWSWLNEQRLDIARSLKRLASELPRREKHHLKHLARWFNGKAGFEKAIKRADVLAICVPFLEYDTESSLSQAEIDRAVRAGFCTISRSVSNQGRVVRLFLFPAMLVIAMAMLAIFFSIWVIPEFEATMVEFGMSLPKLSRVMFKLAWITRNFWPIPVAILASSLVFVLLMNFMTRSKRNAGESWLDKKCMSRRNQAAGWAWHMAMLLDSGIGVSQAVEIANATHDSNWLFRSMRKFFGSQQQISTERERTKVPIPSEHGFQLVRSTLAIDNPNAQPDLLREIATFYWAECRAIGEWWSQCAVSVLFWMFAISILFLINALLSPLISLISGMSGGWPGKGIFW